MSTEELLDHSDFVHSLARSLVLDNDLAADIEQQAWLAALSHPPADGKPMRSWFARVIRNLAATMYRSEGRRMKHERNAAPTGPTPTPEEIVTRGELGRHLMNLVMELDDPYRTAILYRYYENLPPREIAKQLDMPVERVRTHLKRGLARLRTRLDVWHKGKRSGWMMILAPFAGVRLGEGAAAAAAPVLGGSLGAGLMAKGSLVAVLLAVLLIPMVHWVWTDEGVVAPPETGVSGTLDSSLAANALPAAEPGDLDPSSMTAMIAANPNRVPLPVKGFLVKGKVTDGKTGKPVETFEVTLLDDGVVMRETIRDGDGRFEIRVEKKGVYTIKVTSSRHLPAKRESLELPLPEDDPVIAFLLDPGQSISGRVVEDETGVPVKGALIGTDGYLRTHPESIRRGDTESCVHTESDGAGKFTLKGLLGETQKICALHPDFAQARVEAVPGIAGEIELRLEKGFRVRGKVYADNGEPAEGILISVRDEERALYRCRVTTDSSGTYETAPYGPGKLEIEAYEGLRPEGSPQFTSEEKIVFLVDKDREVNFGIQANEYATWRGTLLDRDGAPIPEGRFVLRPTHQHPIFSSISPRNIECNEEGRFCILKIPPGPFTIQTKYVPALKGTKSILYEELLFDRPNIFERDIKASGSIISGVVIDGETGKPWTGDRAVIRAVGKHDGNIRFRWNVGDRGRFAFMGIPPGMYNLTAEGAGRKSPEITDISVGENQVIENLRLVIHDCGRLHITSKTVMIGNLRSFQLFLERTGDTPQSSPHDLSVKPDGRLDQSIFLVPGEWFAILSFHTLGLVKKRFHIRAGETTELVLEEGDLTFFDGEVTVEGTLTDSDGKPVPRSRVFFDRVLWLVPGLQGKENSRAYYQDTDAAGHFIEKGLKPGFWRVRVSWRGGKGDTDLYLRDLEIPPNPPDTIRLDLRLPAGRMTGDIQDSRSGQPLGSGLRWSVYLTEEGDIWERSGGDKLYEHKICNLSEFKMTGIAPGRYYLTIDHPGFHVFHSKPFDLKEGGTIEMGHIALEPCGVLDLEVVDRDDAPIQFYSLFCNGIKQTHEWNIEPGTRWDNLPLGRVEISVQKDKIGVGKIEIDLEADKRAKARIVLH